MSEYIFVTNIFEYSNIRIYSSHSAMNVYCRRSAHTMRKHIINVARKMREIPNLSFQACASKVGLREGLSPEKTLSGAHTVSISIMVVMLTNIMNLTNTKTYTKTNKQSVSV